MASQNSSNKTLVGPVKYFDSPLLQAPQGYSHVSQSQPGARIVEAAGQVGENKDGRLADNFAAQALQAFTNLKSAFAAAGARPEHVLKVRIFIKDFQDDMFVSLGKALHSVFDSNRLPPALLASVPRLANSEWLIEVEGSAAVPVDAVLALQSYDTPAVEEVDIAIVGAGLSGLQAAVDLQKAGLKTVVFESMDRPGGKTLSVSSVLKSANKVDLGAAWINDTTQEKVWALAQRFGLQTTEQRIEGWNFHRKSDGTVEKKPYGELRGSKDDVENHIYPFFDALDKLASTIDPKNPAASPNAERLDSVTVLQWAEGKDNHPSVSIVAKILLRAMLGVEPDEISLLSYLTYIARNWGLTAMLSDRKGGGQYLRIRGGTQQLSIGLSQTLVPGSLRLASPVKKIQQLSSSAVRLEVGLDKVVYAEKVIVTVPTPVYSKIQWEPSLPPSKQLLAESTKAGAYSKFVLVYQEPWWRQGEYPFSGEISADEGMGPITFSRDTSFPEDNMWAITCFMCGADGRKWSTLTAAARKKAVLDQVHGALSSTFDVPQPIATHEVEWVKNEWVAGAPCPITGVNVITAGGDTALREVFGAVHFAGTETSTLGTGFMDGALRSGERAAEEVVEALAKEQ
ncbi:hypothetical protein BKA61DRAFT_699537 [Leptodontidium sp. MPI-SDFR-AT-0119]|nr:hypothetical protein BKA61DRAFT_699537 [Leptodontidium sp. MPI-SDFR-AT-0119]